MVQGKGPEGPLVPGGAKGGACALLGRGGRPPSPSCAASAGLPSAETEAAESAWSGCTVAWAPSHWVDVVGGGVWGGEQCGL